MGIAEARRKTEIWGTTERERQEGKKKGDMEENLERQDVKHLKT